MFSPFVGTFFFSLVTHFNAFVCMSGPQKQCSWLSFPLTLPSPWVPWLCVPSLLSLVRLLSALVFASVKVPCTLNQFCSLPCWSHWTETYPYNSINTHIFKPRNNEHFNYLCKGFASLCEVFVIYIFAIYEMKDLKLSVGRASIRIWAKRFETMGHVMLTITPILIASLTLTFKHIMHPASLTVCMCVHVPVCMCI